MNPILTTICPYWGRPEALKVYLKAMVGASIPEVRHLIFLVDEEEKDLSPPNGRFEMLPVIGPRSIGHYHNLGAEITKTEWIMKSDVDVIPNVRFFRELIPVLRSAQPREWFNAGFLYIDRTQTNSFLSPSQMPLSEENYLEIVRNWMASPAKRGLGSQFICRREDYLSLGGGDRRFEGWGWEDYQQMFMLEWHQTGVDPLSGEHIDIFNVSQRCRDRIARPKAQGLWDLNHWMCLFHQWHSKSVNPEYWSLERSDRNKQILFDYVRRRRDDH